MPPDATTVMVVVPPNTPMVPDNVLAEMTVGWFTIIETVLLPPAASVIV